MNKKYSIRLFKISDCEDPVFPENIDSGFEKQGFSDKLPEVGKQFFMCSEFLISYFRTSIVMEIVNKENGRMIFKTMNSFYSITYEENMQIIDVKED